MMTYYAAFGQIKVVNFYSCPISSSSTFSYIQVTFVSTLNVFLQKFMIERLDAHFKSVF